LGGHRQDLLRLQALLPVELLGQGLQVERLEHGQQPERRDQRLTRPDLVVEHEVGGDFLTRHCRMVALTLAEISRCRRSSVWRGVGVMPAFE